MYKRQLPAASPTGNDGSLAQSGGAGSEADNSANLLQSALGVEPALVASPDKDDSGPFNPVQIEPGTPGDFAELRAPTPNPSDPSAAPDSRGADAISPLAFQKMPAYSVVASHIPEFRDRDLFTSKGMEAESFKRHPGLLVGNQFNLNADAAHELYLDDDWRATKSDYWNMARAMAMGDDLTEGRLIVDEVTAADMSARAEAEVGGDQPSMGQFQLGEVGSNSRFLEAPAIPFDFTVVRMKW